MSPTRLLTCDPWPFGLPVVLTVAEVVTHRSRDFTEIPPEGAFKEAHSIPQGHPYHIPLVSFRVPTKGIYKHP